METKKLLQTTYGSTALSAEDDNTTTNNSFIVNDGDDEEEDDIDEWWNERLAILEDAKKLKEVASYFLHPEYPVQIDSTACARCYYGPNLDEVISSIGDDDEEDEIMEEEEEEEEEYMNIMNDMRLLKMYAQDYLEPQRQNPVEVHPLSSCRNYFTRYGSTQQETFEESEERNHILEDTKQLKKFATFYMHPELPCTTTDPYATGRNIFTTSSFMTQQKNVNEMKERDQVLAEAQQLKKSAIHYMHPELPCVTSDPYATGRNFFDRPLSLFHDDQQVHTYCEYVEKNTGYHHIIDHDHHYYWYNHDDELQFDDVHDDEDGGYHYEFKENTYEVEPFKPNQSPPCTSRGNSPSKADMDYPLLSSSPSSVLLLTW